MKKYVLVGCSVLMLGSVIDLPAQAVPDAAVPTQPAAAPTPAAGTLPAKPIAKPLPAQPLLAKPAPPKPTSTKPAPVSPAPTAVDPAAPVKPTPAPAAPAAAISPEELTRFSKVVKQLFALDRSTETQIVAAIEKTGLQTQRFMDIYLAKKDPAGKPGFKMTPDEEKNMLRPRCSWPPFKRPQSPSKMPC